MWQNGRISSKFFLLIFLVVLHLLIMVFKYCGMNNRDLYICQNDCINNCFSSYLWKVLCDPRTSEIDGPLCTKHANSVELLILKCPNRNW